ncbi:MAG: nitroreductase family protein [Actinobacteria bacterium]|nr:nitroreductase family protein [Actinomycetota bacterium]
MIEIDRERCSGCNLCASVCIGGPIYDGPEIRSGGRTLCVECGHCYAICPEEAVRLTGFGDLLPHALPEKPPVDGPAMMSLLRGRRSGRMYREEPVSREHVREMIEAASLAPSAHNSHLTRAYVCYDEEVMARIRDRAIRYYRRLVRFFELPGFPFVWKLLGLDPEELEVLEHAFRSLWQSDKNDDILLYGTRTLLTFTAPRRNAMALGDAWIAAQNAVIYAEAIGVATCYNGFLIHAANHDRELRMLLGAGKGEKVVAVLNLGYPRRRFRRAAPRRIMDTAWR